MKTSSGRESHDDPGVEKARGYVASNAVLPGLGSLAAGRKVGVVQLGLCLGGFALTLGAGVPFISWSLAHWAQFWSPNPDNDPFAPLIDLWHHARWPLAGIAVFSVSWLWSLLTSRSLLADAKSNAKSAGRPGNAQ